MRDICILKAGRRADRAGFASLLAVVAMYGPAAKRCPNTACRGKGQRPADFPAVPTPRLNEDAEPVLWPRYFGLGCTAFRPAAYSNVGAMEFGA
jgi:hypothetical protein